MNRLFISLFTVFAPISTFLSATVVQLAEWERPNGTRLVLMYDVHLQSKKEELQQKDIVSYLQSQKNTHLLVEDPREMGGICPEGFLSGFVSYAKKNNLQSSSLEFRLFDYCDKDKIMQSYESVNKDHIPSAFVDDFEKLRKELESIKSNEDFEKPILRLADFVFLSRIMDDQFTKTNMYIVVGAIHAHFLASVFEDYGFVKKVDVGEDPGFDKLFDKEWNSLIDTYALDLKVAFKQSGK